jgi:multiple sugar transport system substrate-binding protein
MNMEVRSKRFATYGLVAAMVLLAGCTMGTTNKAEEPPVQKDEPKTPVELKLYNISGIFSPEEFEEFFFKPLKAKHPHITIRVVPATEKLDQMVASNNIPDILVGSNGDANTQLTQYNLQLDVTPLAVKTKYDLSQLQPAYEKLAKTVSDGKLYGLPLYAGGAPIYYNKDLFDKFGVPYPSKQLTWDEVYALSQKLTRQEGGVQYYGFLPDTAVLIHMNQRSLPLLDASGLKPAFNTDDRWKAYLQSFKRFYDFPGSEIKSASDATAAKTLARFNKDLTLAMFLSSNLRAPSSLEAVANWDLTPYPTFADAPNTGPMPYAYFGFVTSTSKHQEEAFQALAYFASEEFQLTMSEQARMKPVVKSEKVTKAFATKSTFYGGKNVSAVFALNPAELAASMFTRHHNLARTGLLNAFNGYLTGAGDINSLLRTAEETVVKNIQAEEEKLKAQK